MNFLNWIRRLRSHVASSWRSTKKRPPPRFRPWLEGLEERAVPATLTVASTFDDGGATTLRTLINTANSNGDGSNVIRFDFGDRGTQETIVLDSTLGPLPTITKPLTLDGIYQGGVNNIDTPFVCLDGNAIAGDGLTATTGNVIIKGLAIDNFNGNGIVLDNPSGSVGDQIWACYIGTDLSGTASDVGNTQNGVLIKGGDNTVGDPLGGYLGHDYGNIISGNGQNGIQITGTRAQRNVVAANYIGVDITGSTALGNTSAGVQIDSGAGNNTIGGTTFHNTVTGDALPGNVISGNGFDGINLNTSTNNKILSNTIGLGADGSTVVANGRNGVALFTGAANNTIGSSDSASGNVISGNTSSGVLITGPTAQNNRVIGNLIGTNETGAAARGNVKEGVNVNSTSNNTIGGMNAGEGNVISGNTLNGVKMTGTGTHDNLIAGDKIGTNEAGSAALANQNDGILLGGDHNTVGATGSNGANIISGNANAGIEISGGNAELVVNNYIGTDAAGTAAIGNVMYGMLFDSDGTNEATNNTIGGTTTAQSNIISGNGNTINAMAGMGIFLGNASSGNVFLGNDIGIDALGNPLGNQRDGVYINTNATGNTIGGAANGAANWISANGQNPNTANTDMVYGVYALGSGNRIENNLIGLDGTGFADPDFANLSGWKGGGGTNDWVNNNTQ
jgi:parallel beta-helix repeat protein